jgi:hypothetical protein
MGMAGFLIAGRTQRGAAKPPLSFREPARAPVSDRFLAEIWLECERGRRDLAPFPHFAQQFLWV